MRSYFLLIFLPLTNGYGSISDDVQEYGQDGVDQDLDDQDKQSNKPHTIQGDSTIAQPQSAKTKKIDFNAFDPDIMDPDSLRGVIEELTSQANQFTTGIQPIEIPALNENSEYQDPNDYNAPLDVIPICDPFISTCCDGVNYLWGLAISGCETFSLGKLKCRSKSAVFCCRRLRFDWGWRCFSVYSKGKGKGKGRQKKVESTSSLEIESTDWDGTG